jgi:hypothetical protein
LQFQEDRPHGLYADDCITENFHTHVGGRPFLPMPQLRGFTAAMW